MMNWRVIKDTPFMFLCFENLKSRGNSLKLKVQIQVKGCTYICNIHMKLYKQKRNSIETLISEFDLNHKSKCG